MNIILTVANIDVRNDLRVQHPNGNGVEHPSIRQAAYLRYLRKLQGNWKHERKLLRSIPESDGIEIRQDKAGRSMYYCDGKRISKAKALEIRNTFDASIEGLRKEKTIAAAKAEGKFLNALIDSPQGIWVPKGLPSNRRKVGSGPYLASTHEAEAFRVWKAEQEEILAAAQAAKNAEA